MKKTKPKTKDQIKHEKMIRCLLGNIGFSRIAGVENCHFTFRDREGELDDVFYYENIVLLVEYTTSDTPGDHLKNKIHLFSRINEKPLDFLKFVTKEPKLKKLSAGLSVIRNKYSIQEIQIKIVYASRQLLDEKYKKMCGYVSFLDYGIAKYFEIIAKSIKKSTRYEFFDFLEIDYRKIGDEIKKSSIDNSNTFSAEILPETKSCCIEGIKIVTFYIDAISLLKRAYVLRSDSWRNNENITLFQRLLVPHKIKKMREYLVSEQRVFINNIIVALSSEDVELKDSEKKPMKINDDGSIEGVSNAITPARISIPNKPNIIGIVDGQHRLFAYHEGMDCYEQKISTLRESHSLLVSGIIMPKEWNETDRIRFQSKLFLEINSNQQSANAHLKQYIESILHHTSPTSISTNIIKKLNESGPLKNMFAISVFDEHKIKTASIISFALNILIRPNNKDGLWGAWTSIKKDISLNDLKDANALSEYQSFCVENIRNFFIAMKANLPDCWEITTSKSAGILNVTSINGMLNCIRFLAANNKLEGVETYKRKLKHVSDFDFRKYKSSQYLKMGQALYDRYWNKAMLSD